LIFLKDRFDEFEKNFENDLKQLKQHEYDNLFMWLNVIFYLIIAGLSFKDKTWRY
jgi:hypothetical protein